MMRHFDAAQTAQSLPFEKLIGALEQRFAAGCSVPLRHNHSIDGRGTLLLMPAWDTRWLGVKTVSVFPDNRRRNLPGLHSVYILYCAETGKPVALFDGDSITSRRTAAASALAARFLSRRDSKTLLVLGAGRVAALLLDAYRVVRNIERVLVWNITPDKAEQLAAEWRGRGIDAQAVSDLAAAAGQADIISCATLSTEPLVRREWLKAGTHLDLIGGFSPAMRESDDACFVGTEVFVDTEEALMKAGDLLEPMKSGVFAAEQVCADLRTLCSGGHAGRSSDDAVTVFKSVGTALEDLAAAVLAYENLAGV